MFGSSPVELIVIGSIAVLLFGSRLPSVARSMGKSVTEFKKGIRGIEEDIDVTNGRRVSSNYADERDEPTVPKFEPPKSEPRDEAAASESAHGESTQSESPQGETASATP